VKKLTDEQEKVLYDIATHDRIAVKSGHGVGKTKLAAIVALYFKYCYWPSTVLTTAPTERQVKNQLWKEIRFLWMHNQKKLNGKIFTMYLDVDPKNFMLGFTTSKDSFNQAQGFHSPYFLIIIDEANGYPDELIASIISMLSGGIRAILFMIGNPVIPNGYFFNSFSNPAFVTTTISCLNHPNVVNNDRTIIPGAVTREWVEEQRKAWGEESAFWQSRILGNFPTIAEDLVVNLAWVENAEKINNKPVKEEEIYLGHDPGELGDDPYVWYIGTPRRRIIAIERKGIQPSEAIAMTVRLQKDYNIPYKNITIDGIGAGATIYSVLLNDYSWKGLNRFVASSSAKDSNTYVDATAEAWFNIRRLLNPLHDKYIPFGFGGPADAIKADLCTRKFKLESRTGRYMMEPKPLYRKRMKRSPNFGDAFTICYYPLCMCQKPGIILLGNLY
jgi:hypothetical protein